MKASELCIVLCRLPLDLHLMSGTTTELFAEKAISLGYVSKEQADACVADLEQARASGLRDGVETGDISARGGRTGSLTEAPLSTKSLAKPWRSHGQAQP